MNEINNQEMASLALQIKQWGQELGFQQVGITDTDLIGCGSSPAKLAGEHFHGEMDYMQRHGVKRSRPALLHEGTVRAISVRMDYLPGAGCRDEPVSGRSGFSLYFPLCLGSRLSQNDA